MFTVVVSVTYLPLSCPPQEFPDSQWHRYHPNQPVHSRDDPSRHRPAHGVHPCRAGDTLQGAPIRRLQGLHPTQGQGHVLRWGLPINTQHLPKDAGSRSGQGQRWRRGTLETVMILNELSCVMLWKAVKYELAWWQFHVLSILTEAICGTYSPTLISCHGPAPSTWQCIFSRPNVELFDVIFSFSFLCLEHYGITIHWPHWWLNCFAVCLSGLFMLLYEILRRYCILWSHLVWFSNACFILS